MIGCYRWNDKIYTVDCFRDEYIPLIKKSISQNLDCYESFKLKNFQDSFFLFDEEKPIVIVNFHDFESQSDFKLCDMSLHFIDKSRHLLAMNFFMSMMYQNPICGMVRINHCNELFTLWLKKEKHLYMCVGDPYDTYGFHKSCLNKNKLLKVEFNDSDFADWRSM